MQKQATEQAEEDKRKRAMADQRNFADHLVYMTQRMLEAHGAKLREVQRETIAEGVKRLQEARNANQMDAMKQAIEALSDASRPLSAIAYTEGIGQPMSAHEPHPPCQAPPSPAVEQASSKSGDPVVDAEFEPKKE